MIFLSYMSVMTIKLDNQGLRSIISEFDLLFIDIWGVIHNGINLYQDSIDVLDRLEKEKKRVCFINKRAKTKFYCNQIFEKNGSRKKKM